MILKKIVGLIFLLFFTCSFGEKYVPKNNNEIKIINKFRDKNIIIGLYNIEFYNRKSSENGKSINDVIVELFNDYLGLNVTFEKGKISQLMESVKEKKNHGISIIGESEERFHYFEFSIPIYNDSLYLVSSQKKIKSIYDLEGEKVYVNSKSLPKNLLDPLLLNRNIDAQVIEVDDLSKYIKEFVITTLPSQFNTKYTLKIGNTSNVSIGISHEMNRIIPIINNALSIKYKGLILEQINRIKTETNLENLTLTLTSEEINYLKKLKEIEVVYNRNINSDSYYYSKIDKKIHGIIPNLFEIIGRNLDIPIVTSVSEDLDILTKKNAKKIYILSKTKKRNNKMVFTRTLYDVATYKVKLKNINPDSFIGVVNNNIEEEIMEKYTLKKHLKKYNDYESLVKALNRGEIQQILTTNIRDLDINLYDIYFFEEISMNLALKKEDIILRNILDKTISNIILIDEVIYVSKLEKSNYDQILLNKENLKKNFFIACSLILMLLLIYSYIKIYKQKEYRKKLMKDPISGLQNRAAFNEFCLDTLEREGYGFVLALNGFENIKDIYYHKIGDQAIYEFSEFLKKNFESADLFRILGDEFHGIITGEIDEILDTFKSYVNYCPTFVKYSITYSLGLYYKKKDDTLENTFKYANMAMFKAKKRKGVNFYLANDKFIEKKKREEKILDLLNGELSELYPVFQPKINLDTKEVIGAETLARCISEKLGFISPAEFIPIAENYSMIHRIDYKMAEESIILLKALVDEKKIKKGFRLSFNLSSKTISRRDLIETISELLSKYDVSGSYLEVEITESLLIEDMSEVLKKLKSLIELGIQISLDDFTAGHSTAGILPLLPLSIVKLDKSLLDSIKQNKEKGKIVYLNMISLIKELDLKIVSEGIETEEEFDFLKKSKVDYGQGFFIGKPNEKIKL